MNKEIFFRTIENLYQDISTNKKKKIELYKCLDAYDVYRKTLDKQEDAIDKKINLIKYVIDYNKEERLLKIKNEIINLNNELKEIRNEIKKYNHEVVKKVEQIVNLCKCYNIISKGNDVPATVLHDDEITMILHELKINTNQF